MPTRPISQEAFAGLCEEIWKQSQTITRLTAERNQYWQLTWFAAVFAAAATLGMLICWVLLETSCK